MSKRADDGLRRAQGGGFPRERLLMDPGWKFHLGDIPFPKPVTHEESYRWGWSKSGMFRGAADPQMNDSEWRTVDLPHDWAVEGNFSPSANMDHGFLPTGIGWYRKTFLLPAEDDGKRLFIEFDGIFRDATVYLNGHRIGHEPSGYVTVRYDITDQALYGDENVIAVRVDASEGEGWWYEGAGIYRHVWMVKTAALHVVPWGVVVSSQVETKEGHAQGAAELCVQTSIANEEDADACCELVFTVFDPNGETVAEVRTPLTLSARQTADITQSIRVNEPRLWSVDEPRMYRIQTTVLREGKVVDGEETAFGIRTIRFDADKGFFLNGRPLKLKGTSNHQDHAGLGVALPDRVQEFRVRRLKEMGANAWRCAHNPPAPEFLDACDRLGMLVMDETRCMNSTADGLRQLESMVRRDRNHPSVILWSLGNEEVPHQATVVGKRIIGSMKRLVRRLDPTRPVTLAMSAGWGGEASQLLDVMGCNYLPEQYDDYHRRFPLHPMVGSETSSALGTRGEYANDDEKGYRSAYDVTKETVGNSAETAWRAVAEREFMCGTFPWTGFDYRGEPSPRRWPCVASNYGILDSCGFPKDNFFYYQSWWSDRTVLHLLPHWNWQGLEGEEIVVWCHSNCDRVELFLNGASLGVKDMPRNGRLDWKVRYAPGVLSARSYSAGRLVAEHKVETTGAPARIALTPDRAVLCADGEDVSMIAVAILDEQGRTVPYADNEVDFSVCGNGRLIGTGNGNPSSLESDKLPHRRAFHGLCQAILQSTRTPGEIILEALSPGLPPTRLVIRSEPCAARPCLPAVDPSKSVNVTKVGVARLIPRREELKDAWTRLEFDDAGWKEFSLSAKPLLCNHAYVRIRFVASAGLPSSGRVAALGAIHDCDETWLNGVLIGSINAGNTSAREAWQTKRVYNIPDGLLRPGLENVLAIHTWSLRTAPDAGTCLAGLMRIS